jgi:hypothetical protein
MAVDRSPVPTLAAVHMCRAQLGLFRGLPSLELV